MSLRNTKNALLKISLPLYVHTSAKNKFILNLNNYRNLHYRTLASAKRLYASLVYKKVAGRRKIRQKPLTIVYDYWHGSKRKHDVLNQVSIIDKFALDAIVATGTIEDDNTDIIKQYIITDRGVDKDNPRAEMRIIKYEE